MNIVQGLRSNYLKSIYIIWLVMPTFLKDLSGSYLDTDCLWFVDDKHFGLLV